MPAGVLIALCAYAIYSCGDAIIKGFSGHLTVFEIGFFTACFSLLPAMVTKQSDEQWRRTFQLNRPWLVHLRSASGVCSSILVTYSFTTIPLAEVYSIVFLAPVFITIISVLVLKEHVSAQRWLLLFATFAGVLIVVRPGFRELHPGHFAALAAAVFSSINTTVLRRVSPSEKRLNLFGVLTTYTIGVNAVLMLPDFHLPSLDQFVLVFVAGCTGGIGQLLFIAATRRIPASQLAPVQYSQIVWAMIFGAAFYSEFPDHVALVGLAVVVIAGVLNVVPDEARWRAIRRFAVLRGRPASAAVAEAANDLEAVPPTAIPPIPLPAAEADARAA
jgi:drug/metabolite transporter (DMT)-like permease